MSDMLTFPAWCDNEQERQVPRSECKLVTVPTLFYNDHVERDLTQGITVKAGKLLTQVWIDRECFRDLYSDADYYCSFDGEDYEYNRTYCDSARTMIKRLRQGAPEWASEEERRIARLAIAMLRSREE